MNRPNRPAAIFRKRFRALERNLSPALTGGVEAIHDSRVASRRLREALPVVTAGLSPDLSTQPERAVRRITRSLGKVRELDVVLEILADVERDHPDTRPDVAVTRSYVEQEHATATRQMRACIERLKPERLLAQLATIETTLVGEDVSVPAAEALAGRLTRRADRAAAAIDAAGLLFVAGKLHQVRIALKKLRYSVELAGELARARTRSACLRLKHVQDLLGRLHDLDVAVQKAHAASIGAPADRRVRDLVTLLDDEIRQCHARYLKQRRLLAPILAKCHNEFRPALAALATRPPVALAG
jgi:CHAD domain-containing protein